MSATRGDSRKTCGITLRRLMWGGAIVLTSAVLVLAARCYLLVSAVSYNVFWSVRYGLLLCALGVAVALPVGLAQIWNGPRRRYFAVYLTGAGIGALGAFLISLRSVFGWMFGVAMFVWATTWVATTLAACAFRWREEVERCREWLTRSYVVTLAFVVFWSLVTAPVFADIGLRMRLTLFLWISWSLPLVITELVLWRRLAAAGRVYFI